MRRARWGSRLLAIVLSMLVEGAWVVGIFVFAVGFGLGGFLNVLIKRKVELFASGSLFISLHVSSRTI